MKRIFIALAFLTFCTISYSQDSTKRKVEKKTQKTAAKVKQKAKTVSKRLDNKTDSVVKKVYPNAHKVPK
jgi:hypothetical protein